MDVERFLVMVGNPVDGVSFYGPFYDGVEAVDWAEAEIGRKDEWNVTSITVPEGARGNGLAEGHSVGDQDVWGEDGQFGRADWQYEVANGDTNLGYWGWVEHQRITDFETKAFEAAGK